jgi:hypothetical protein
MKPFILRHAVHRIDGAKAIYFYDFERSLNVVKVGESIQPFIDSDIQPVTLGTATKVKGEREKISNSLIEVTTGTRVKQEKNDRQPSLLELATKTFVQKESDD